jgi:hypothetical protein
VTDLEAIDELARLLDGSGPVFCELSLKPTTAIALHGLISLALAHPEMTPGVGRIGEELCAVIEAALAMRGASDELIAVLRRKEAL